MTLPRPELPRRAPASLKLADGSLSSWATPRTAGQSANSQLFVASEVAIANDAVACRSTSHGVVTRGDKWVQPDLSKVDEVGFTDLYPGSGHGWGGFVNVAGIEVYRTPVKR